MENIKISLHDHPLELTNSFTTYPNGWWHCNICERDKNPTIIREGKCYHCNECGFDGCRNCIIKIVTESFGYDATGPPTHVMKEYKKLRKFGTAESEVIIS